MMLYLMGKCSDYFQYVKAISEFLKRVAKRQLYFSSAICVRVMTDSHSHIRAVLNLLC